MRTSQGSTRGNGAQGRSSLDGRPFIAYSLERQAPDEGGTFPPSRVENSWKERNRGTIVTIVSTDVNVTAVKNDELTQPNRGRVAVSFSVGDGNKGPNSKCGAIYRNKTTS